MSTYFSSLKNYIEYLISNVALVESQQISMKEFGWRVIEAEVDKWETQYPQLETMENIAWDFLAPDIPQYELEKLWQKFKGLLREMQEAERKV